MLIIQLRNQIFSVTAINGVTNNISFHNYSIAKTTFINLVEQQIISLKVRYLFPRKISDTYIKLENDNRS